MDLGFLLFALAMFVTVVLLLEGGYVLWDSTRGPEVQRLQRRLRMLRAGEGGSEEVSLMKRRVLSELPRVDRWLQSVPRVAALDRWLQQSGTSISVGRLASLTLLSGIAAFLVAVVLRVPVSLALVAVGVPAGCVPALFVSWRRTRRLRRFDEQLPDALELMARALRAGHAFPVAMQMVATDAAEPVAGEFQIAFEEVNFGVPMQDAMTNLAARVPSMDLRCFVVSVLLQRETGGNLAELLDNLAILVRERFKLFGRVRVLSAEGRLSAYILIVLPFLTAAGIHAVNPAFMALLWSDPVGFRLVIGALAMMIVGAYAMWRIVKIRV